MEHLSQPKPKMQPLSTNRATVSPPAGADQPFIAARFACLALATVCFSAAAGLEGSKMDQPLIAALPGTLAAAAIAYRAKPALALTPPLTLDDVAIQEAPGKGEGLFARRRIEKGEFVMVRGRRPRLVFRGQRLITCVDVNTGLFGRRDGRRRRE